MSGLPVGASGVDGDRGKVGTVGGAAAVMMGREDPAGGLALLDLPAVRVVVQGDSDKGSLVVSHVGEANISEPPA